MKRARYNYLLIGSLLGVILVTLSSVLGLEIAASANSSLSGSNSLVYLPIIEGPGDSASPKVAGVPLYIGSPHLPGEMVSSETDDVNQLANAFTLDPFQEFSITAAPYGASPPTEDLPDSEPGGAGIYRAALSVFRTQQGGTPLPAPALSLFGQNIAGSYSIINLITTAETKQPTMIAEWVVEAESSLWIVRITRDLNDGTDPTTFLKSHQSTIVKVDTAAVDRPSAREEQSPADPSDLDASFQSPTTLPVPSWWSGNCNVGNHAGSYSLSIFDGLVACGPTRTARLVYFFPGAVGQYEWQCTELAKRYLYLKHDIHPYQANGKDVVNNMPQQYIGTLFERISNGTPNKSPAPGDVISFGPTTTFGHVAVVTTANIDANGNGSIEIIEQNWSQDGRRPIPIANWRVGGSIPVSNWLHLGEMPPLPSGQTTIFDGFTYYEKSGFQFSSNSVVAWNSNAADILSAKAQSSSLTSFFLQYDAPPYNDPGIDKDARSGIIGMSQTELAQVSECPESGYEYHWVEASSGGVYCVRTRDGQHYAKIKLTSIGNVSLSFTWVYQPDGSRKFH